LDLKPSADDLKKKREQIDIEYRKANEKRSQLSLELSQLRAEYELDLETLKDRQEMVARDLHALQVSTTEVQQYKDAILMIKKETCSLQEKIDSQKYAMNEMQSQARSFGEETAKLREANQKVFEESRNLQLQFDVLEKMVESGKDEYRIVKENLELEGSRLEQDRQKVQALEQQVSVQAAITERERLRGVEIERERKELDAKSRELKAAEARLKEQERVQRELDRTKALEIDRQMVAEPKEMLASAISPSGVVIPENVPPPPVPSLNKKPTQASKENIVEALSKETNSPMSALSAPAALQGKIPTKQEQDSADLDSLLSGNKPKSNSVDEKRVQPNASTPDFESFFANPSPIIPQGTATKSFGDDIKKAMEMAFANTTLKAAKDSPSLGSSSTIKRTAIPTDQFTFDSSFSAPQPLLSGSTSSKKATNFGKFDDTAFTGFKQQANPVPQDLDSVFGGAPIPAPTDFSGDPFGGSNAFASIIVNENTTKSSPNFGNDPFGASSFDSAPFPPPTAIASGRTPSPTKGNDTPEVASIKSMGFTREQAVNALEM
jgi:hypothetical protein